MINRFSGALAFLLLIGSVQAISSNDAVNYVANSNHFLYDGETYTPPNVQVAFGGNSYWVVPITSGNGITTYFALDSSTGALSTSRGVNRGLFGVADDLRELQLLKASISPSSGVEWVFTQKYQAIFNEMSLQLNDNVYQLNTVQTALEQQGVSADVSPLKSELSVMSALADSISKDISDATIKENAFFTQPSQESLDSLKSAYKQVTDSIGELNSDALAYNSNRNILKNEISLANIDAQTKSQLLSTLEIPSSLQALGNYNLYAIQVQGKVDSSFQGSSLRIDSLLDEFDKRMAKNEVNNLIYGQNAKVKQATGFDSLFGAQATILSKDNRLTWKDQAKVKDLETDYGNAVDYYSSKRDFATAKKYALLAIDDAIAVYKAGPQETPPPAGISQDDLFKLAGLLVVILVLLYIFNNRGKIKGVISKEPEEVDVYGP